MARDSRRMTIIQYVTVTLLPIATVAVRTLLNTLLLSLSCFLFQTGITNGVKTADGFWQRVLFISAR